MSVSLSPEKESINKKAKAEIAKLRQENVVYKATIKQMKKQVK
jgi:hypothetical protein